MQNPILLKRLNRYRKTASNHHTTIQGEQGIALVMALLMGMVLMGGATALMVRMMGARKLSSSESYQQLAEAAAVNGFNRILATLNSPQKQNYLGYLYLINNIQDQNGVYGWDSLPEQEEPCASKLTIAPDWHSVDVALQDNGTTLRSDNAGDLRTFYRLRRYTGPSQTSSAQFEIEGVVKRDGSQNQYEARSLLKRSLFVNSRVPTENDWAVLAARDLELRGLTLTDSTNQGKGGMIINLLTANSSFDASNADSCNASNLLGLVKANSTDSSLANHIWPVKNINNNNWDIPQPEYFNGDNTTDTFPGGSATRIWAFNDEISGNPLEGNYGLQCGSSFSPICSRPSSSDPDSQHAIPIDQSQIKFTTENTLVTGLACVAKKNWENQKNTGSEGEIYDDPDKCDSTEDKWQRRVEWQSQDAIVAEPTYTITLKESDLCTSNSGSSQGNVCHIYIEQINLKRSSILIENSSNRPIVLHLKTPDGFERRSDIKSIQDTDYIYQLTGNSQLCGINASGSTEDLPANTGINNPNNCNLHAERFILATTEGDATQQCYENKKPATLRFGGSNLPAAMISMPNGNIELNESTTMKAVIWASSICVGNNNQLALSTTSADGNTPIVIKAEEQWQWAEDKRYGRTVVRGIRGTGFDTFSRW